MLTYMWPVRLSSEGRMRDEVRNNPELSANDWTKAYAEWLTDKAKHSPWNEVSDYYRGEHRANPASEWERYAEFNYFHPFVQDLLFGEQCHRYRTQCITARANCAEPANGRSIRILSRSDIRGVQFQLRDDGPLWKAPVNRVNLLIFPTDVAIAVVEVSDVPQCHNKRNAFTLADALDTLDWTRRTHPPFFDCDRNAERLNAGLVPKRMSWLDEDGVQIGDPANFDCASTFLNQVRENRVVPVADHWSWLMQPLRPQGMNRGAECQLTYSEVEDDRLPVLALIGVDHPQEISDPDWVRIAYCDSKGPSFRYPYARHFLEREDQSFSYDRFWDPDMGLSTRLLCTSYSFIAVGSTYDYTFREHVTSHIRMHYFILLMLAHMQKASLLSYLKRLSDIVHVFESQPPTPAESRALRKDIAWVLQDLTDFVSRFYHQEISNQLQAIELYDLILTRLRIRSLFKAVVEQTDFVNHVATQQWQEDMTREQTRLSRFAGWFVPWSIALAAVAIFLGLPTVTEYLHNRWLRMCRDDTPVHFGILGGLLVAVIILVWILYLCFRKYANHKVSTDSEHYG